MSVSKGPSAKLLEIQQGERADFMFQMSGAMRLSHYFRDFEIQGPSQDQGIVLQLIL